MCRMAVKAVPVLSLGNPARGERPDGIPVRGLHRKLGGQGRNTPRKRPST